MTVNLNRAPETLNPDNTASDKQNELDVQTVRTSSEQSGLMELLKPHRPSRGQFFIMAIMVLFTTALELFIPLYSKYMVDTIGVTGLDYTLVLMLIGIVLAAAIAEGILAWYGSLLGEKTNVKLRFAVFKHLLHTEQESLNNEHSAELSARVVNDSMAVKSVLAEDLIGFVTGLVSIFAVVAIMFVLDWRLTLVLVSCILLGVVLITPLAVSMRGIGQSMQEAEAKLIANVTEWLRSATTIKVHNASSPVLTLGQQLLDNAYFHAMRQARVMALIGPISNLILMVSMIAILASSAVWLADGSLTLGTVTAFLIYLFGLAFPIMAIGMFLSNVHRASGAAVRLNQLLGLSTEQTKKGVVIDVIQQLSVQGLTYENDGKRILDDIHWQFKPNTLTVLKGESGSGKSTLVQQLVGLYTSTFNNIKVNNIPLSDIQLDSLRSQIAWVEQSPSLFMGTVRDNLCLGLEAQLEDIELISAISAVGLDTWFEKNDRNLDLVLTEKMQQLSGGERQRLALARAVLRKPSLLILDEPTSALDKQTEGDIMKTIRELANNTIVLLITHNPSLIHDSDEVITMDSGRLHARD